MPVFKIGRLITPLEFRSCRGCVGGPGLGPTVVLFPPLTAPFLVFLGLAVFEGILKTLLLSLEVRVVFVLEIGFLQSV